jgi:hypothetical protein
MKLSATFELRDLALRLMSKLSYTLKPRSLEKRITSFPYLCSDTYEDLAQKSLLTHEDFTKFISGPSRSGVISSVFVKANLVQLLIDNVNDLPTIERLILIEDDVVLHVGSLSFLYSKVQKIFASNLIGSTLQCKPIPLGIERQVFRSAGKLKDFKKPVSIKPKDRDITFLVAWNDETNSQRPLHRSRFMNRTDTLILSQRINASSLHSLMRKSMFVPSPAGNGPDCHRTWEAIYLGAVPVVLKSDFCGDEKWPILVVHDWSELLLKNAKQLSDLYCAIALNSRDSIEFGKSILEEMFG